MQAYPLQWPVGYKRTDPQHRKHAQFKTSFASARDCTIAELKRMGCKLIIISSNIPLKKDGLPYAVPFGKTNVVDDVGIAVYFDMDGTKVIACDAYPTLDDNMQAIFKTIEALRGIDRWKCSEIISRSFTGFTALPETVGEDPYRVLGINRGASKTDIKRAYTKKLFEVHPDHGGNESDFIKVKEAFGKIC